MAGLAAARWHWYTDLPPILLPELLRDVEVILKWHLRVFNPPRRNR